MHIAHHWSGLTGANVIVSGTAVFGAENPRDVMEGMRDHINEAKASWAKA